MASAPIVPLYGTKLHLPSAFFINFRFMNRVFLAYSRICRARLSAFSSFACSSGESCFSFSGSCGILYKIPIDFPSFRIKSYRFYYSTNSGSRQYPEKKIYAVKESVRYAGNVADFLTNLLKYSKIISVSYC